MWKYKSYYQRLQWHFCVTLQGTNPELPEDNTVVSKHEEVAY